MSPISEPDLTCKSCLADVNSFSAVLDQGYIGTVPVLFCPHCVDGILLPKEKSDVSK